MGRRTSQSKELVRLSPLQFSVSISIVVILLGGAGLAGYYYGQKRAIQPGVERNTVSDGDHDEGSVSGPEPSGAGTAVTFYSALTEPRKDVQPLRENKARAENGPAAVAAVSHADRSARPANGAVMIQVASYKDKLSADRLLEELSSERYSGSVVRADLGDRGIWYRVRIGPYASEKEARSALDILRKERSLKGYIVK